MTPPASFHFARWAIVAIVAAILFLLILDSPSAGAAPVGDLGCANPANHRDPAALLAGKTVSVSGHICFGEVLSSGAVAPAGAGSQPGLFERVSEPFADSRQWLHAALERCSGARAQAIADHLAAQTLSRQEVDDDRALLVLRFAPAGH